MKVAPNKKYNKQKHKEKKIEMDCEEEKKNKKFEIQLKKTLLKKCMNI